MFGSPGFAVKGGRIWGCERAYARSHPQIRVSTTEFPKEPNVFAVALFYPTLINPKEILMI